MLLAALSLLASSLVAAQDTPTTSAWELAQLDMEDNHWHQAYEGFARLADEGDVRASRLVYEMWLYGPTLYGQTFPARLDQVQRWAALCECTPIKRAQRQSAR